MTADLGSRIADVAARLLGEPNRTLSPATQLRYGANGSLAIEIGGQQRGRWFDHEAGVGGGVMALIQREIGLTDGAAVEWLEHELGIGGDDQPATRRRIVATYDYRDETGQLLFQVVRFQPKAFKQRRPDGAGGWNWRVKGVQQVPYRLGALLERPENCPIYICEGEKDVDRLAGLGLVATCNAGGAGKWQAELSPHLRDAIVHIIPDNDAAGRDHARQVASSLHRTAAEVRIVELPGLAPKQDVSDWLTAGGTVEQLTALCRATPVWAPGETLETDDGIAEWDGGDDVAAAGNEAAEGQQPARSVPSTEDAIALAFARGHVSDLRHVALWSKWLRWDGARWADDETLDVFDLVRRSCRQARKALPADASEKLRAILASARTVAAVEKLAKSDRRLAATVEQWDRDLDLLNTPTGVVDLRTGTLRPSAATDYCTKITAVAPAPPRTDCPLWRVFLDRIMAGDDALIRFLQRVAGYALTGLTTEHALFFCYGGGANGKGVFLNTLTGIFADYATTAAMETFSATNGERHPTDLAMLRGARLVASQETEEGRRWAEAKIKALTGGDPVTARFMRQDFFTFQPQFKLLVAGNHKPGLRGVDEAVRRRLNLIPFAVTIPPSERDPNLAIKLQREWPAILRWAIDGCLEWRRRGLDQPPAVRVATEEYMNDEDAFGRWLEECCLRSAYSHETTADLFGSWRKHCERTGEPPGTEKRFRESLKQRDFAPKRQGGTGLGGFAGIALVRPDYTDDPRYGG